MTRLRGWWDWLVGNRPPVSPPPPPPPPSPSVPPATSYEEELLLQHNQVRAQYGAPALKTQRDLVEAAREHAALMASQRKLSHQLPGEPSLSQRVQPYQFSRLAENIAAGQKTVTAVMNSWLGSPPHRDNILNAAYQDAGFGVIGDTSGQLYWCAVFAASMHGAARHVVADLSGNLADGLDDRESEP